jgi:hypothetical protein
LDDRVQPGAPHHGSAAPGVGKTYEMLTAARAKKAEGVDVVIGNRRGRIPKEPSDLYEGGSSDAPFPGEVQFFLDFLIAGFSPDELSK